MELILKFSINLMKIFIKNENNNSKNYIKCYYINQYI